MNQFPFARSRDPYHQAGAQMRKNSGNTAAGKPRPRPSAKQKAPDDTAEAATAGTSPALKKRRKHADPGASSGANADSKKEEATNKKKKNPAAEKVKAQITRQQLSKKEKLLWEKHQAQIAFGPTAMEQVFSGEKTVTDYGLRKQDLMQDPETGRIVSKKQYQARIKRWHTPANADGSVNRNFHWSKAFAKARAEHAGGKKATPDGTEQKLAAEVDEGFAAAQQENMAQLRSGVEPSRGGKKSPMKASASSSPNSVEQGRIKSVNVFALTKPERTGLFDRTRELYTNSVAESEADHRMQELAKRWTSNLLREDDSGLDVLWSHGATLAGEREQVANQDQDATAGQSVHGGKNDPVHEEKVDSESNASTSLLVQFLRHCFSRDDGSIAPEQQTDVDERSGLHPPGPRKDNGSEGSSFAENAKNDAISPQKYCAVLQQETTPVMPPAPETAGASPRADAATAASPADCSSGLGIEPVAAGEPNTADFDTPAIAFANEVGSPAAQNSLDEGDRRSNPPEERKSTGSVSGLRALGECSEDTARTAWHKYFAPELVKNDDGEAALTPVSVKSLWDEMTQHFVRSTLVREFAKKEDLAPLKQVVPRMQCATSSVRPTTAASSERRMTPEEEDVFLRECREALKVCGNPALAAKYSGTLPLLAQNGEAVPRGDAPEQPQLPEPARSQQFAKKENKKEKKPMPEAVKEKLRKHKQEQREKKLQGEEPVRINKKAKVDKNAEQDSGDYYSWYDYNYDDALDGYNWMELDYDNYGSYADKDGWPAFPEYNSSASASVSHSKSASRKKNDKKSKKLPRRAKDKAKTEMKHSQNLKMKESGRKKGPLPREMKDFESLQQKEDGATKDDADHGPKRKPPELRQNVASYGGPECFVFEDDDISSGSWSEITDGEMERLDAYLREEEEEQKRLAAPKE
ncbi:unnamed protein product [Amoebophrya sp. A120]|nr:unnamed protein product [Amoebophrya sp. A120]|eukprot:GSA120T00002414001.1